MLIINIRLLYLFFFFSYCCSDFIVALDQECYLMFPCWFPESLPRIFKGEGIKLPEVTSLEGLVRIYSDKYQRLQITGCSLPK